MVQAEKYKPEYGTSAAAKAGDLAKNESGEVPALQAKAFWSISIPTSVIPGMYSQLAAACRGKAIVDFHADASAMYERVGIATVLVSRLHR